MTPGILPIPPSATMIRTLSDSHQVKLSGATMSIFVEKRLRARLANAAPTIRDRIEVVDRNPNDLAESHRDHREVIRAQPKRWRAEQDAEYGATAHSQRKYSPEWQEVRLRREPGDRVCADCIKRNVAE